VGRTKKSFLPGGVRDGKAGWMLRATAQNAEKVEVVCATVIVQGVVALSGAPDHGHSRMECFLTCVFESAFFFLARPSGFACCNIVRHMGQIAELDLS
jgi:hypothetical protein